MDCEKELADILAAWETLINNLTTVNMDSGNYVAP